MTSPQADGAASVQLDGERRRLAQQVELKALALVERQASVRAQVLHRAQPSTT